MPLRGVSNQLRLQVLEEAVRQGFRFTGQGPRLRFADNVGCRPLREAAENAIDSCLHENTPSSYCKPLAATKVPVSRASCG